MENSMKENYKPTTILQFEDQINKYISERARRRIYELLPDNSTARLKVLCVKVIADHPTATLSPQLLQYAIGGNPKFPRCIGSMIERLAREDDNFPKQILSFTNGKKNPSLSKEKEQELLDLLD
jgi:hypothetical protein